jgi:hypothetical protein
MVTYYVSDAPCRQTSTVNGKSDLTHVSSTYYEYNVDGLPTRQYRRGDYDVNHEYTYDQAPRLTAEATKGCPSLDAKRRERVPEGRVREPMTRQSTVGGNSLIPAFSWGEKEQDAGRDARPTGGRNSLIPAFSRGEKEHGAGAPECTLRDSRGRQPGSVPSTALAAGEEGVRRDEALPLGRGRATGATATGAGRASLRLG